MRYVYHSPSKFSHQNIVPCVGVSLRAAPHLILLELMSGGDVKKFPEAEATTPGKILLLGLPFPSKDPIHVSQNLHGLMCPLPNPGPTFTSNHADLLQLVQDIAQGCHYLEENHFVHRLEGPLDQLPP